LISKGTLKEIKKFLSKIPSTTSISDIINHTKEGRGRIAIHFAAARADKTIFEYIYDLTTDKTAKDEEGNTVLFIST